MCLRFTFVFKYAIKFGVYAGCKVKRDNSGLLYLIDIFVAILISVTDNF